ncbi:MAG: hypothetical protein SF187_17525 [Deltaproteobacteria bacterium]|nr:hypothetical protein [Deltaproteobacteria bacterium]
MLLRFHKSVTTVCFAVAVGLTALPEAAHATPEKGSLELRLPGGHLLGGFGIPQGIVYQAPTEGSNTTLIHVAAGLGYFLTDNFELGGHAGLFWGKSSDFDEASAGPEIGTFVRGFSMITPRLALFAEGSFNFIRLSQGEATTTGTILGLDAGLEFFLSESWALRVAPAYRHSNADTSSSGTLISGTDRSINSFGIGWGVAAYF